MTRSTSLPTRRLIPACLAAAMACAACSGYGPSGLKPGAGQSEVIAAMGAPTAEHPPPSGLPGAAKRLEYARGPMGKHTYMLDFDAQGRLLAWEQVLTEKRFFEVRKGWTQEQLRQWLGTPSNIRGVGWRGQKVWSYRFESPFCVWFEVSVEQGLVTETGQGPDPQCDNKDNDIRDR